ncbi:NUDIX domain-containing protein [Peribacillus sp. SCS-37]|uniref:NUDIX domain-containing protein n=1 Tax=Paraperibacillus esterisolvens TaxID=3115296 RepID=UPI0039057960
MGMSQYYSKLRETHGSGLLLLPSVAGIIRNDAGEIMLQNKGNGEKWSLPAGALEPGETPADAVAREVWEETGLRVTPKRLAGVFGGREFRYQYPNGHEVEYVVFLFECEADHIARQPVDEETAELRFFKPEEMPELALPYPLFLFTEEEFGSAYFQGADKIL